MTRAGRNLFVLVSLLAVTMLPSCSVLWPEPKVWVSDQMAKTRPMTVAILPMSWAPGAGDGETAKTIREIFYNNFSALPFKDIELFEVDYRLAEMSRSLGTAIADISPQSIGKALGCDAVIRGTVTDCSRMYAAAYSQVAVGLAVAMFDTHNGAELFRIAHENTSRSAGLPVSPIGAAGSIITTAWHLRHKTFVDTTNELCREMVVKIPEPDTEELLARMKSSRPDPDLPAATPHPRGETFVAEALTDGRADAAAVTTAVAAEEEQADETQALLLLGKLHMQTGQYEKAAADFEKLAVLNPDSALVQKMLAQIYGLLGQADEQAAANLRYAALVP